MTYGTVSRRITIEDLDRVVAAACEVVRVHALEGDPGNRLDESIEALGKAIKEEKVTP